MRTFFLVALFAFFTTFPAVGQSVQTFVHDFGEHKIYQRFGKIRSTTWVTTIKIEDRQCKQMFVSLVNIKDNRVVFKQGGTVWKLQETEGGMNIEFPDGNKIKYKPVSGKTPIRYCTKGKEI